MEKFGLLFAIIMIIPLTDYTIKYFNPDISLDLWKYLFIQTILLVVIAITDFIKSSTSTQQPSSQTHTKTIDEQIESTVIKVDEEYQELHKELMESIPSMVSRFIKTVETENKNWQRVYDSSDPKLTIHQSPDSAFAYRIHAHLDAEAENAFNFMTDIESRPQWDDLIEEARILAKLDKKGETRVLYIKMKAIWPTKARDLVLLSHMRKIVQDDGEVVWLNVTKTIKYPRAPTTDEKGTVRIKSDLAGQIIKRLGDGRCDMVQLADGDPGAWIPSSVVSFVATKAMPNSIRKLNKILSERKFKKSKKVEEPKETVQQAQDKAEFSVQYAMEKATPWMVATLLTITIVSKLLKHYQ